MYIGCIHPKISTDFMQSSTQEKKKSGYFIESIWFEYSQNAFGLLKHIHSLLSLSLKFIKSNENAIQFMQSIRFRVYVKSEILLTLYSLCKWYVWHHWKRPMNASFSSKYIKYSILSKCMAWMHAVLELQSATINISTPYACDMNQRDICTLLKGNVIQWKWSQNGMK